MAREGVSDRHGGLGSSTLRVFLRVEEAAAAIQSSREFARAREAQAWRRDLRGNYKSLYTVGGAIADEEVVRIAEKGFAEIFATREEVLGRWPEAKAGEVALLIKERADSTIKTRLVVDL